MEKVEGELKDLNKKYEAIVKRIESIPEEIVETTKRTKDREYDLEQILGDIEKARKQRQGLLVTGGKVDEVSAKIKTLWEKCDLIEDEVVGLKTRVRELHGEEVKILEDKESAIDEIIKVSLGPLVEQYNTRAQALSVPLKEILSLMDRWGMSFGDSSKNSWGKFISPSSWVSLRIISRLFLKGESVGDDFFNIIKISQARSDEEAKRVCEKVGLSKG